MNKRLYVGSLVLQERGGHDIHVHTAVAWHASEDEARGTFAAVALASRPDYGLVRANVYDITCIADEGRP